MAIAQLAARRSHNPKVVSSILTCHITMQMMGAMTFIPNPFLHALPGQRSPALAGPAHLLHPARGRAHNFQVVSLIPSCMAARLARSFLPALFFCTSMSDEVKPKMQVVSEHLRGKQKLSSRLSAVKDWHTRLSHPSFLRPKLLCGCGKQRKVPRPGIEPGTFRSSV